MHQISQKAKDLIIREEVSSKAYYERHYQHPEWPGGASGVTIGIGYDLGYATKAKVTADWGSLVSPNMLPALLECTGVKGAAAKALLPKVKQDILIPWDAAMKVFEQRDLPQWIAATYRALPNCDLLSPTCLGVLVSLNYNRGVGGYTMPGDRYTEMRQIKQAMVTRGFPLIGGYLDSMARLWPGSGVAGRRHREADLYRQGLSEPIPMGSLGLPPPNVTDEAPLQSNVPGKTARTKPPVTSTAQNTTTGGLVAGPVVAAAHAGLPLTQIILIALAAAVVAGGVWFAWYKNRNPS